MTREQKTKRLLLWIANGGTIQTTKEKTAKHGYASPLEVEAIHFIWLADEYEIKNREVKNVKRRDSIYN